MKNNMIIAPFTVATLTCMACLNLVVPLAARSEPSVQDKLVPPVAGLTTFELKDIRKLSEKFEPSPLKISVSAIPQQASNNGLSLDLIIDNPSEKEIQIVSPLDLIRFELKNDKGRLVRLPSVPSRFQIDRRQGTGRDVPRAFKVGILKQAGKILPASASNAPQLTVPAKGTLVISISIDQVSNSAGGRKEEISSIGAGIYKVLVSVYIIEVLKANTPDANRLLQSSEIPVELG